MSIGGALEAFVDFHMILPPQTHMAERDLQQITDRVRFAGGEYIVIRPALLQHQPHRMNVVLRIAPVASGIQISEADGFLKAGFNSGGCECDFASHKVFASPRAFVVVTNRVAEEEAVRFAVDLCHLSREGFGTSVGRVRIDGRGFVLTADCRRPKDFPAAGMQKLRRSRKVAQDFHDPQTAHRGQVTGAFGDLKAESHMRLAGQMIEFGGLHLVDNAANGGDVGQVGVVQEQLLFVDAVVTVKLVQTRTFEGTAAAHDAVNFVALFEEQFGQIGTVLAGDTGDEGDHRVEF